MWIRNNNGFYICEVRGVCSLTWVNTRDKSRAATFPKDKITEWVRLMSEMAGEQLEAVEPFV